MGVHNFFLDMVRKILDPKFMLLRRGMYESTELQDKIKEVSHLISLAFFPASKKSTKMWFGWGGQQVGIGEASEVF